MTKVPEIAEKLGMSSTKLTQAIKDAGYSVISMPGLDAMIDDELAEQLLHGNVSLPSVEESLQAIAEERVRFANMLITSGFSFDGYTITKYSGYISGDAVIEIPRTTTGGFFTARTGNAGQALSDSLSKLRQTALRELKEAANALGCNAVVGVDFDYITMEPENGHFDAFRNTMVTDYLPYVFCVTANGNAVVIEKNS